MQIGNAREYFGALAARGHELRLGASTGTWLFDVGGAGTWTVRIDDGKFFAVVEGRPPVPPTASVQMSEAEFVRLANGDAHENPLTGLLRGVIRIGGELPFAGKLFAILPMPDAWKDAR